MTITYREMTIAVDKARGAARQAVRDRAAYHIADELEAEAVASVARSSASFDASRGVPFPLYASRRAYGAALDHVRRWRGDYRGMAPKLEAARPTHEEFDWQRPEPVGVNRERDPAEIVEAKDELVRVLDLINRLPDIYRDAVDLHVIQGLTLAETGRRLGVTEAAISLRIVRVRRYLRERLALDDLRDAA